MRIIDNHSAFNSIVVRNGIKIHENTSVRSYIMESKIKKAMVAFYESLDAKPGAFIKFKMEFQDSTGKLLPYLQDLERRIERMSVAKMELAMNALFDEGIEECLKVILHVTQNKKEESHHTEEPPARNPLSDKNKALPAFQKKDKKH